MTAASQDITAIPAGAVAVKPPIKLFRNMAAKIAMTPMMATVIFVFIGCTVWTIFYSFTGVESAPGFRSARRGFRRARSVCPPLRDAALADIGVGISRSTAC